MTKTNMGYCIKIDCNPPNAWGANSKQLFVRGGKPGMTDGKNTQASKDWLYGELRDFKAKHFTRPLDGPLRLLIVVTWPYLKTEKKAVVNAGSRKWKTTTPDGDNGAKTVKDCLERSGFFLNDSLVCDETVRRSYGPEPGLLVEVMEMGDVITRFDEHLKFQPKVKP